MEEIPTVPTTLESFAQRLSDLPLERIVADIHSSMNQIALFLEGGTLEKTVEELNLSLASLSTWMAGHEVDQTLEEFRVQAYVLAQSELLAEASRTLTRHPSGN